MSTLTNASKNLLTLKRFIGKGDFLVYVIIQHPKITVRIQDEVLALRTYFNSYLGAEKAHSASDRPATRDAQHPESGVLNSYIEKFRRTFLSENQTFLKLCGSYCSRSHLSLN